MASSDPLKALIERQPKSKPLSPRWRTKKPERSDFGLEDCSITDLVRRRNQFENDKQRRIRELASTAPAEKTSVPFGWEGISLIVISVISLIYFFAFGAPYPQVTWGLFALTILIFLCYIIRNAQRKNNIKKRRAEIADEKMRISREPFPEEDTYDKVFAYAEALSDYETWQERRKTSFWKTCSARDAADHICSIYTMLGFLLDDSYSDCYSFVLSGETPAQDRALAAVGGKRLTVQFVDAMAEDMEFNELSRGMIYAFSTVDNQAARKCENAGIEICGIDDILALVAETEKLQ